MVQMKVKRRILNSSQHLLPPTKVYKLCKCNLSEEERGGRGRERGREGWEEEGGGRREERRGRVGGKEREGEREEEEEGGMERGGRGGERE